jgi:hypothetical protein
MIEDAASSGLYELRGSGGTGGTGGTGKASCDELPSGEWSEIVASVGAPPESFLLSGATVGVGSGRRE